MALEGSLKEFNVADILQLLFFQKKTGALILQGRSDKIRILFHEGNIVSADSRKRGFDKRLVWILAKRGYITQEHLDAAMTKAKTEGGKFTHHLVADGIVTKDEILGIYSFLVNEIMSRMFSMREGLYEFKPQAIPVDKEMGVELNTEHFLMEGVRMVDEWGEIEGRINLDDVFVRDEEAQVRLDENEEQYVALADGVFDVADVADILGVDSFTSAMSLLKLEERGAIYRMGLEDELAEAPKPKSRPKPIPFLQAILAMLMVIFFVLSFFQYFQSPGQRQFFDASEQLYALRLEVQAALDSAGSYPDSIAAVDPWGGRIIYKPGESGFELYSPGPDSVPGTADDIY